MITIEEPVICNQVIEPEPKLEPGRERSDGRGGRGRGRGGRGRGRGRGSGRGGRGRGRGGTSNKNTNPLTSSEGGIFNTNSMMPICTFFMQNRCTFGSSCRFYHPESLSTPTNGNGIGIGIGIDNPPPTIQHAESFKTRQFNVHKAEAIAIAKNAQDIESNPYASLEGPFYSMDIECIAIGYGHAKTHRYPCRVALVKHRHRDREGGDIEILLDEWVNLKEIEVVSYMTELTGTTEQDCLGPGTKNLDNIRNLVKNLLPSNAILVGHSIQHDIEWLGLHHGVDFRDYFDNSIIFRQRIPKNLGSASNVLKAKANQAQEDSNSSELSKEFTKESKEFDADSDSNKTTNTNSTEDKKVDSYEHDDSGLAFPTRYRVFSLRHCCLNLLDVDIQSAAHNPVTDAKYSLMLFSKYKESSPQMLRAVRDSLHRSIPTNSFASGNPVVDGVCLSPHGYRLKNAARFILAWLRVRSLPVPKEEHKVQDV